MKNSWLDFFRKLWEFIKYTLSFLKSRKQEQQQQAQEEKNKITDKIKKDYAKIDKKKEEVEKNDIQKRLDNLF